MIIFSLQPCESPTKCHASSPISPQECTGNQNRNRNSTAIMASVRNRTKHFHQNLIQNPQENQSTGNIQTFSATNPLDFPPRTQPT